MSRRRVKKFRHTTALGHVVEVEWTPDGLRVVVEGEEHVWAPSEDIGQMLEYSPPSWGSP